jgi:hypothetical protein
MRTEHKEKEEPHEIHSWEYVRIKGSFKALQRFSDTLLNEPNIVKAGERISVKLQED